ncbi:TatD family hydrolase [Jiulongibacter sediminis]|uniref:Hydrolase TatD n=1 Tax=Jiulongibacter sediminis TaxID=1605367 RepID=A0A0P7BAZ6_9BACT|nr:TatD family hydrolase [Jiulongibacter sediminis]KPM47616.1 hydrolase TatD [Jiulongibacter sediminis]TBX23407.1 hydrolase TatD [Jiulongibacter sediminis]
MIETHAHIYDEVFKEDEKEVFERAREAGVKEIWMPNCNSGTIAPMLEMAEKYPGYCIPMMGLHPCYVKEDVEQELQIVEENLAKGSYFMIGEIGLDFYWDLTFVKEQESAFLKQLELAKKHNLPICIHSRNSKKNEHNAILRCCELIEEFGWEGLRGIFHCFSGNLVEAKRVIGLNFLLGIGGVSTFKNGGLDKVLPYVSIDKVVLETDSPYLAPTPYRGKRNEVAYVELVAERVALLMGLSKEEVVEKTTENAMRLKA